MFNTILGGILVGIIFILIGVGTLKLGHTTGAVVCFICFAATVAATIARASDAHSMYVVCGVFIGILLASAGIGMLRQSRRRLDQRFRLVHMINAVGVMIVISGACLPFIVAHVM